MLCRLLPEEVLGAVQQAVRRAVARDDAAVHGVRLAGQRPRAREPDQADGRARQRGADPQGDRARHRDGGAPRAVVRSRSHRRRPRRHARSRRVGAAGRRRPRRRRTPARSTPTEIACAAAEAGNYSLKDISRTAAREAERELIFKMLQQTRWNRKETAEILGISYKALLYKIKENGLDKAS